MKIDKLKDFILHNLKWIVLFGCVVIFLSFVEDVFKKEIMNGDVIGHYLVSKYLISDFMTPIMSCITWFGGPIWIVVLTVLLFVFIKEKKICVAVLTNLVTITVLNQVFKFILQRPRPEGYRLIAESGYSFPSGHSMVSMAFYGFLIYLIYYYFKNKHLKWTLITILGILIVLIGLSRIYLGVHYTSDVCAGFVFSLAYLILYISVINKIGVMIGNEEY